MANVHGWKTAWRKTNEKNQLFSPSAILDNITCYRFESSSRKNLQIFSVSYFSSLHLNEAWINSLVSFAIRREIRYYLIFIFILSLLVRVYSVSSTQTNQHTKVVYCARWIRFTWCEEHKNMMRDEGEKWVFFSRQSCDAMCAVCRLNKKAKLLRSSCFSPSLEDLARFTCPTIASFFSFCCSFLRDCWLWESQMRYTIPFALTHTHYSGAKKFPSCCIHLL